MTLRVEPLLPGPSDLSQRVLARARLLEPRTAHELAWRHTAPVYLAVMMLTDFLAALVVSVSVTRGHYGTTDAVALSLVVAASFVLSMALCRGYRRANAVIGTHELTSVLRVTGVLGIVSLALPASGILGLPHPLVFQVLLPTVTLVTLTRLIQRTVVRHLRAEGRLTRRALLVGPLPSLRQVFSSLDDARFHGLKIMGICTPERRRSDTSESVVGTYDTIPQRVADLDIETVIVSADAMDAEELRRLGWALQHQPVELLVLPPLADVLPRRLRVEAVAGTPLLAVSFTTPRTQLWSKAVVDRTLGAALLLLALPIILTAGLAVRLTSRGPAFFSQTRVGLQGRHFKIHKLRSMYLDAEARRSELLKHNDGNGMLFKLHDDPRVTPIGRKLRRLSIDELPQLWNVVKGDMSLVGPRPALPHEVAAYEGDVAHRLAVRPGLTGLWQVSGRSNLSAERSVQLDLRYADNWTVGMDVSILLRTARAVVSGDGAY